MATSKLEICNDALMHLGAQLITTAELTANTLDRAKLCNQFYDKCRKWVWKAHPWKSGLVVDTLKAFTEPAGTLTPGAGATVVGTTGVIFTASVAPPFAAGDIGKRLIGNGVPGKALITGFTSTTVVTATIEAAFASLAAIPTGSWRLYQPEPDHTWAFTILLPADFMRFKDMDQYATENYRMINPGDRLVSSVESLDIVYVKDETDTTKFEQLFEEAFSAYLASKLALPVTGSLAAFRTMTELYQIKLTEARSLDSQQGTPDQVGNDILVRVRSTGLGPDRSLGRL